MSSFFKDDNGILFKEARSQLDEALEIAIGIIDDLCGGFLYMPSGCEGCPLFDEDLLDVDGNIECEYHRLRRKVKHE